MEQAIKLAIEKGGYKPTFIQQNWHISDPWINIDKAINGIWTDPLFWQALGKVLNKEYTYCPDCGASKQPYAYEVCGKNGCEGIYTTEFIELAHKWLDAHFEGSQVEEQFWKELLNQTNETN